jgi:hypothetical protein
MSQPSLVLSIVLLVPAWLACLGCAENVAQVTGKLTLQSQPVSGATVVFETEAEPTQSYFGASREDGQYNLDLAGRPGLAPSSYTIRVTDWTLPNGSRLPPGEGGELLKSDGKAIGRVYSFHRDVAAGSQTIDLALDQAESVETVPPSP